MTSGNKSQLTVSTQSSNKATINSEGGKAKINFVGTTAKSPTINGDDGKEIVKIKDDSEITGKARINLGGNKDTVVIDGIINNLIIDNGVDDSKDTITIDSQDLIGKKLKVKNFGEEDKLKIEGAVFRYQDMGDSEVLQDLKDIGVVINLAD